jgi:hypothetical protein
MKMQGLRMSGSVLLRDVAGRGSRSSRGIVEDYDLAHCPASTCSAAKAAGLPILGQSIGELHESVGVRDEVSSMSINKRGVTA